MAVDVGQQLPYDPNWRIDERLLSELGHAGHCRKPERLGRPAVGPRPLPIMARRLPSPGDDSLQQMQIYGVSFDMVGKQPIVLLKTVDGNRFLPIWIGHPEAAAILMKLQGASTPRPMTHDLLSDLLEQVDAKCERVSVTELRDNTFYASITISINGSEMEIDSRPSDAIALAVRTQAPIFAADDVIDESSIEFEHEVEDTEEVVRVGEPRDRVRLEDLRDGIGVEHQVDACESRAAQELVRPAGHLLHLGGGPRQLGGAEVLGAPDLVARLVVEAVLLLRSHLHHGQRLPVEQGDGELPSLDVTLE